MSKGKIELLTLDFPPITGGISHYLYEIFRHLPSDTVRVIGVAVAHSELFDSHQPFEICRLKVPTKPGSFQKQLKYFAPFYLAQLVQHRDISFILCGQAHYSLMLPAWIVSSIRCVPFGIFAHGLDLLHPQVRSYKALFNTLLRETDILFVNSIATQNIARQLTVDLAKIHVVYPSVDADNLPRNLTAQKVKHRHSLADKKCILTVGRLVERKGHDKIIQALPLILQKVPNAHYLIVGSGPYEVHLKQLVAELRLENHITFAGYVPQTELGAYFSACNVFTMISREIPRRGDVEGFGIVYLQANLLGKAVVAGRSGGVPEAVLDQQTGLLVNPLDVEEIAQAIARLLIDVDLAHSLACKGKQRVLSEFSSDLAAQKVITALQTVQFQ